VVKVGVIDEELTLRIDGAQPVSAAAVEAVLALCDRAEDRAEPDVVTLRVSGTPSGPWTGGLNVGLVSKWERTLLRLERLSAFTVAVAEGECGGAALDALLVADYRLALPGTRLLVPSDGHATWPGMALYRLAHQAGPARIRRAALLGVPIEADEALVLGIVDELSDDPAEGLAVIARQAAGIAGRELAIRRRLLFDAATTTFEDALGAHLAACDRHLRRVAEAC
jgi:isomerase DpgB